MEKTVERERVIFKSHPNANRRLENGSTNPENPIETVHKPWKTPSFVLAFGWKKLSSVKGSPSKSVTREQTP